MLNIQNSTVGPFWDVTSNLERLCPSAFLGTSQDPPRRDGQGDVGTLAKTVATLTCSCVLLINRILSDVLLCGSNRGIDQDSEQELVGSSFISLGGFFMHACPNQGFSVLDISARLAMEDFFKCTNIKS